MEGSSKYWKVQDKRRLLLALMDELAENAHISFEGDLEGLRLLNIQGASEEPTPTLKRNTLWPKQDFVIVPIERTMSEKIMAAIGGTVPLVIIHIQIEKDGLLQFGAYDNFQPECVFFGSAVKQSMIDWLVASSIMRPYTERPTRRLKSRIPT